MELKNARNLRNARIFRSALAAVAGLGMLHWVSPVRAQSASGSAVPRRFFSMLDLPGAGDGALLQAPAGDKKEPGHPDALPEGKGKSLTQKECVSCHAIGVVTKERHTRDQWRSILDTMLDKGLDAPDGDLDTIADYLAANFGPAKSATQSASPDAAAAPATQ